MKVLITSEHSLNKYIYYLYLGISSEAEVVCATQAFWTSNLHFDILHIHWPELLVDYRVHEDNILQILEDRLLYWKNLGTKIVFTRHNYLPHRSDVYDGQMFSQIYNIFYKYTDAIVHMGEASLEEFEKSTSYTKKNNIVISHPNYLVELENNTTKKEARKRLNIKDDDFLFLSFGDIRHSFEEELMIEAFLKLNLKNKKLLITRSLFSKSRPTLRNTLDRIKYEMKRKRLLSNNILLDQVRLIEESNVQYYMNAANVVVIPRLNTLNSGILYLAASFGKTIVGADIGNIGEVLRKMSNPVFNPTNIQSYTEAMSKAVILSKTGCGDKNLEYMRKNCDIYEIGRQYLSLYHKLMTNT